MADHNPDARRVPHGLRSGTTSELVRRQLHHLGGSPPPAPYCVAQHGCVRVVPDALQVPLVVFWFVLVGIMIPHQALIVPQFREFGALHLLNTYWAVILPQIPAAIAVFIFRQFFDGLPRDLEEAARVDGAGFCRHYRRSSCRWPAPWSPPSASSPSSRVEQPAVAAAGAQQPAAHDGPCRAGDGAGRVRHPLRRHHGLGHPRRAPLAAVFLLFQRHIVEGIAGTGLKG